MKKVNHLVDRLEPVWQIGTYRYAASSIYVNSFSF